MLQVDLVSACAGGSTDSKIACETTLSDDNDIDHNTDPPPQSHPDSPPESFWLSRDEEHEWFDRNAVYERKESTKGNSNPNSANLNPNSNANNSNSNSNNSNSQRFLNLKSKGIIGLPKPQKPSFVDAKNLRSHHKPNNITLFPKRGASVGKSHSSLVEPSSPKVSCMGRVRSKRDRNRKLKSPRRRSSDADTKEKPARTGKKPGFFGSLSAIFRSGRKNKPDRKFSDPPPVFDSSVNSSNARLRESIGSVNDASFEESVSRNSVSEREPPVLGGMNRFASGRRSESWGVGESEIHVSR